MALRKRMVRTQSGRLSQYDQPDKERYQEILNERNARAIELGAVPNKRKKRNKNHEGRGYESLKEMIELNTVVDPISGCWIWLKPLQNVGYGLIEVPRTAADGPGPVSKRDGQPKGTKTRTVHRVAYEEYKGEIPPGKIIMHSCDKTYCVNPEHLTVGTRLENTQDMIAKGRDNFYMNLGGSRWNKGKKKYFKGAEIAWFVIGQEPKGWKQVRPKDDNYYVPPEAIYTRSMESRQRMSEAAKKREARIREAKKITADLITQLQANSSPQTA